MTKVYLIAGEASGDFIGSRLIKHLCSAQNDIQFVGVGGKLMEEAGLGQSLFPIDKINLFGFIEIIPHLFRITQLIRQTIEHIISQAPDLLITIDSPGFTYRVSAKVRASLPNLKIIHIVAPSVWVYKERRAIKYARIYDCLFALLPFEPPYFTKVGLDCRYIGHPILEQEFYQDKCTIKKEFNIEDDNIVLCVTAGSRKREILRHLPIFYRALNIIAAKYPNLLVLFVLADPAQEELILTMRHKMQFSYMFSTDRLKSFAVADLALAKSGTNTLEIAASNTPMVVAYKLNMLSYFIIKLLITCTARPIKYVSLINIIAQKEIIPECIQFDCKPQIIAAKLESLLLHHDEAQNQLLAGQKILKQLSNDSNSPPSQQLAKIIQEEFL